MDFGVLLTFLCLLKPGLSIGCTNVSLTTRAEQCFRDMECLRFYVTPFSMIQVDVISGKLKNPNGSEEIHARNCAVLTHGGSSRHVEQRCINISVTQGKGIEAVALKENDKLPVIKVLAFSRELTTTSKDAWSTYSTTQSIKKHTDTDTASSCSLEKPNPTTKNIGLIVGLVLTALLLVAAAAATTVFLVYRRKHTNSGTNNTTTRRASTNTYEGVGVGVAESERETVVNELYNNTIISVNTEANPYNMATD